MFVASLEAMSGSVIRKAERIDPSSKGPSHCFFCASLPYLAMTSIFPVSGAAQLTASEALLDLPNISAMRPYSTFEKPAPSLKWFLGRNMFHNPSFFALIFRSSITCG